VKKGTILFYPVIETGSGTGHLKRCLAFMERERTGELYLPDTSFPSLVAHLPTDRVVTKIKPGSRWRWIVCDRRAMDAEEARELSAYGTVVCFDEGGSARETAPYCIDTLPRLSRGISANVFAPALLDLPPKTHVFREPVRKVLISFGGEDPAGLSSTVSRFLIENRFFTPEELTVVRGPLFSGFEKLPPGILVTGPYPELKRILTEYDLIITAYGLTCFEAIAAGVPVLLFNPSKYHRMLSRAAGLPQIGERKPNRARTEKLLKNLHCILHEEQEKGSREWGMGANGQKPAASLLEYLNDMRPPADFSCPHCGMRNCTVVARFPEVTFFLCRESSLLFQKRFTPPSIRYNRDYFFSEYQNQYGRTYLEDFSHIKALAAKRLELISRGARPDHYTLLDVGCAYGPFLEAADETGFSVYGIDVSEEAVEYVTQELALKAVKSSFLDYEGEMFAGFPRRFTVITMWYVIEHMEQLGPVLEKVGRLLDDDGLFCFSTPNSNGISGRTDIISFLKNNPKDHYTVWSPKAAKKALKRFGFRTIRIRVTGHHPERFPWVNRKRGLRFRAASLVSRLFRLGETFEVYAVKRSHE